MQNLMRRSVSSKQFLFLACVIFPFELIILQGLHAALSGFLPFPVAFLHPSIIIISIVLFRSGVTPFRTSLDWIMIIAFIFMSFPSVLHFLNGNVLDAQFLALGVGGLFVGVLAAGYDRRVVALASYIGVVLWSFAIIISWLLDVMTFFLNTVDWVSIR